MEQTIDLTDQPKTDKRTYIREYKRKQYQEKGEQMREKNKAYYYKYKFGLSCEDMKKYDTLLPLVSKILKNMEELKEKNPTFLKEIITPFISADPL